MKFTPTLGQDLSGSVAGITASRNASGAYFRARTVPSDKFTAKQRLAREAMRNMSPDWAPLSPAEKASWNTYGAGIPFTPPIGNDYNLNGQQIYNRSKLAVKYSNESTLAPGLVVPDTAPAGPGLPVFSGAPVLFDAFASTQQVLIGYDGTDTWVTEDGAALLMRISAPQGIGVLNFSGPFLAVPDLRGSSTSPPTSPVSRTAPSPIKQFQVLFAEIKVYRADGGLSLPVFPTPIPVSA